MGMCLAGLETARAKGKALGRPSVNRTHDKDAKQIKAMRDTGDSYESIVGELGRSKSDVYLPDLQRQSSVIDIDLRAKILFVCEVCGVCILSEIAWFRQPSVSVFSRLVVAAESTLLRK